VRSNLRGTSEETRSEWRRAGDADLAGELVSGIVEEKWDTDVECLIHKDGVCAW
jgi:hypothetical protein